MELLAPNGNKSNLTPEQYKLVRTPEFKAWFGDWENDPENSSKAIDENGEPLVLYHGSNSVFNVFKPSQSFGTHGEKDQIKGIWLTSNKEVANWYALDEDNPKYVKSVFLSVKNPFIAHSSKSIKTIKEELNVEKDSDITSKLKNHDGLLIDNGFYTLGLNKAYIAFNPNQIKLADGINITFDNSNPDIRFKDGGQILLARGQKGKVEEGWDFNFGNGQFGEGVYAFIYGDSKMKNYYSKNGEDIHKFYIDKNYLIDLSNKKLDYWAAREFMYNNPQYKAFIFEHKGFGIPTSKQVLITDPSIIKIVKLDNSNKFDNGGLVAPNGKPTNLTPEQYKLVRTPEFKAWFGDWENDSKNSSKVVDENGEPLVIYHRSKKIIDFFDADKQLNGWLGKGFYFSESKIQFKDYGNKLLSVFINVRNPFIVKGESPSDFLYELKKIFNTDKFDTTQTLKENSYDGVIYKHWDYEGKIFSCFESNQIKIADGTNTTFDTNNPDIRFDNGGEVYENKKTYKKWKSLVNMSKSELEKFYNSQEGKDAGLTASEAQEKGIDSGRESARWIMKMKDTPVSDWTPNMWRWAKKQISFISRMSGNKGGLYDDKGRKTRKHTSLLIWGNNPEKKKFELGGTTMRKPKKIDINKMPTFIAPNGERSNLYQKEEGKDGRWVYLYNIVRTPEFKSWFGDWEEAYRTKDYDGVSKIIDENGEPNICYHATSNEFFEFDENFIGSRTDGGYYGRGFYFTQGVADSHYGQREIPCFLNIKNPFNYVSTYRSYVLDTNELKDKGHDGVLVFPNYIDIKKIDLIKGLGYHGNRIEEIVAYYPEQIKLADATNTTFDKYDNDIRFKDGGTTIRKPKIKSKDSNSKQTVYHGGHDIGSELILRTGYYGGKKTGVDSGAIFFTPSIKYANQYLKHKDGLYKYELEVTDNIFDGTNENHYLRLKDGFIKNWQDEYSSVEDAISDYENAVNSIKSSLSYGAIDWATGSQFLEQISNSGFEGIKFLERPAENIETNSETGEYELSGNPVYSYALFKDEVKVDRFGNGGSIPDLLSSQEIEDKLGRELHWWNDDVVYLSGIKYKKVYLRPEYKRVTE